MELEGLCRVTCPTNCAWKIFCIDLFMMTINNEAEWSCRARGLTAGRGGPLKNFYTTDWKDPKKNKIMKENKRKRKAESDKKWKGISKWRRERCEPPLPPSAHLPSLSTPCPIWVASRVNLARNFHKSTWTFQLNSLCRMAPNVRRDAARRVFIFIIKS